MELRGLYLFCVTVFIITFNFGGASRPSKLKSIKSQDGDVIDCVDITRQPAFDHPLLKNHTIKMKPSYHPEGLFATNKLSNVESSGYKKQITQLWQLSGKCPEGTIPIRRTEKRASSTKKSRNIPQMSFPDDIKAYDPYPHEHAITQTGQGNYYGAKATISAWQPHVERNNEFSLSQIWILAGSRPNLNSIEVGWTVDPMVFGDYNTRLFVYWTSDGYQTTGCYNLICSGFVQTSNDMALGGTISTAGNQREISLLVWKDENQGVWWLQYNGNTIGYWPSTLYTELRGSASLVQWGGEIINSGINGVHTATQMGSGQFPEAGFGKASYFRNLQVVDNSNTLRPPGNLQPFAIKPNCYNIAAGKNNDWGDFFYYGGPGRNPNCP